MVLTDKDRMILALMDRVFDLYSVQPEWKIPLEYEDRRFLRSVPEEERVQN